MEKNHKMASVTIGVLVEANFQELEVTKLCFPLFCESELCSKTCGAEESLWLFIF